MGETVRLPQRVAELVGDVAISSPTSGQLFRYDSTSQKWVNAAGQIADIQGLSVALAGKAPVGQSYTKTESDGLFVVSDTLSDYATVDSLNEVSSIADSKLSPNGNGSHLSGLTTGQIGGMTSYLLSSTASSIYATQASLTGLQASTAAIYLSQSSAASTYATQVGVNAGLSLKLNVGSPTFTGTLTGPTISATTLTVNGDIATGGINASGSVYATGGLSGNSVSGNSVYGTTLGGVTLNVSGAIAAANGTISNSFGVGPYHVPLVGRFSLTGSTGEVSFSDRAATSLADATRFVLYADASKFKLYASGDKVYWDRTGSQTNSGSMTATTYFGDGSHLTGITSVQTKTLTIESPQASENISIFFTPVAISISAIAGVVKSGSTTFSILAGISRASATSTVAAGTVTSTATGDSLTVLSANIPANSFIWFTTGTTAPTSGEVSITIKYS